MVSYTHRGSAPESSVPEKQQDASAPPISGDGDDLREEYDLDALGPGIRNPYLDSPDAEAIDDALGALNRRRPKRRTPGSATNL